MAAQSELMQAQRENGLSLMGGVGCLPLLIQFLFFSQHSTTQHVTLLVYSKITSSGLTLVTVTSIDYHHRSSLLLPILVVYSTSS